MSVSDAQFEAWLLQDGPRVVLVEIDYVYESAGAPTPGTAYLARGVYVDDEASVQYDDAVAALPSFSRSVSGQNLGVYQSSLGALDIANADGRYDVLLQRAIDGSETRVYLGDASWARSDFRLLFCALNVRASAPSAGILRIELKDASTLLNVSIGGTVAVGGSGPVSDKYRPLNFGCVHQVECLVVDPVSLTYAHSDSGTNTTAIDVRDRGVSVSYGDNGDGTITLVASPDGQITADVMALAEGADPSDYAAHRLSDAFFALVGRRAGFVDAGRFAGAHASFTVGDDDDYEMGISIANATNVVTLLARLVDTGNCFYAIQRGGAFVYGRLRPNDIASLGMTPVEIGEDDIDVGSVSIAHATPLYYGFQAYCQKNWSVSSDLATSLDPAEQATRTRDGLHVIQDAAVGDFYADQPQLYDLSLALSPVTETWLSGTDDATEADALTAWMETKRFLQLPWIETLSITVGMEFYALEIGDAVNVTYARFGCDAGALFQVIGVTLRADVAKIDLQLLRRLAPEQPPDGWERETVDASTIDVGYASLVALGVPDPPGSALPPPLISIGGAPWASGLFDSRMWGWMSARTQTTIFLDNFTGGAGALSGHVPDIGDAWNSFSGPEIALDGSGHLYGASNSTTWAEAPCATSIYGYTISMQVIPSGNTSTSAYVHAQLAAPNDTTMVDVGISQQASPDPQSRLSASVYKSDGTLLYDNGEGGYLGIGQDVTSLVPVPANGDTGSPFVISATVREGGGGVDFYINGTLVCGTPERPDVAPAFVDITASWDSTNAPPPNLVADWIKVVS